MTTGSSDPSLARSAWSLAAALTLPTVCTSAAPTAAVTVVPCARQARMSAAVVVRSRSAYTVAVTVLVGKSTYEMLVSATGTWQQSA